jgi:Rrf2 family protein
MLALGTKYAISALLELAKRSDGGFTQVQALSESADVPGPYLSKIMQTLVSKNIVESKKGITGGVRLIKGNSRITFFDVCAALDDPVVATTCLLSKEGCNKNDPCPIHNSWKRIKGDIIEFLSNTYIG